MQSSERHTSVEPLYLQSQIQCPACKSNRHRIIGQPLSPLVQSFPAGTIPIQGTLISRRKILECYTCGLRYYDFVPSVQSLKALYDDKAVYHRWGDSDRGKQQYDKLLKSGVLFARNQIRLLDIGCHTGKFLCATPDTWQKYGVEINAEAVAFAQAQLPQARFWVGPFEEQAIDENYFDLVAAWDVMEHIIDVQYFMQCVSRILKPGGYFIFETGDFLQPFARLADMAWYYYSLLEHTVFHSSHSLKLLAAQAGLELVAIHKTKHDMSPMPYDHYRRANLFSCLVALYTWRGKWPFMHHLAARTLHRAGTLPHDNFHDHVIAAFRKPAL